MEQSYAYAIDTIGLTDEHHQLTHLGHLYGDCQCHYPSIKSIELLNLIERIE